MALQPKAKRLKPIVKPQMSETPRYDTLGNRRRPTRAELSPEELQQRKDYASKLAKERRQKTATVPDRYMALVNGEISIQDLDDEEVFRGQLRNKNGDFRGRPPKFVPAAFVRALKEEQARRFAAEMHGQIPEAMAAIQRVLAKKHPQPGDGAVVNAAFKTIERFAGRVPESIDLTVNGELKLSEQNMLDVVVEYDEPAELEG